MKLPWVFFSSLSGAIFPGKTGCTGSSTRSVPWFQCDYSSSSVVVHIRVSLLLSSSCFFPVQSFLVFINCVLSFAVDIWAQFVPFFLTRRRPKVYYSSTFRVFICCVCFFFLCDPWKRLCRNIGFLYVLQSLYVFNRAVYHSRFFPLSLSSYIFCKTESHTSIYL